MSLLRQQTPPLPNLSGIDKLYSDVLGIILSFLSLHDYLNLQIASKSCAICKLSHADELWKPYYEMKIAKLKVASSTIDARKEKAVHDPIFDLFETVTHDFRKYLIELLRPVMKAAQENDKKRMVDIGRIDFIKTLSYSTSQQVKTSISFKNSKKVKQMYKVVMFGNSQSGRFRMG